VDKSKLRAAIYPSKHSFREGLDGQSQLLRDGNYSAWSKEFGTEQGFNEH
jgi:hypothetical protein